jgi:hypothetical protein
VVSGRGADTTTTGTIPAPTNPLSIPHMVMSDARS